MSDQKPVKLEFSKLMLVLAELTKIYEERWCYDETFEPMDVFSIN